MIGLINDYVFDVQFRGLTPLPISMGFNYQGESEFNLGSWEVVHKKKRLIWKDFNKLKINRYLMRESI